MDLDMVSFVNFLMVLLTIMVIDFSYLKSETVIKGQNRSTFDTDEPSRSWYNNQSRKCSWFE